MLITQTSWEQRHALRTSLHEGLALRSALPFLWCSLSIAFTGAQSEPEWRRCMFRHAWHVRAIVLSSSGLLHPRFLGGTLKWEDDGKNDHYDHHLLLLTSPSFVATMLSSETHPDAEVLGWHTQWCWRGCRERPSEGSQQAPKFLGHMIFFWGPDPWWLVTCLFQLVTAVTCFRTSWQKVVTVTEGK